MKDLKEIRRTYFKATNKEGNIYISGISLPVPDQYKFISCKFHPRLINNLKLNYKGSTFINCKGGI